MNQGLQAIGLESSCEERYLDLLKKYLTRYDFLEVSKVPINTPLRRLVAWGLGLRGVELARFRFSGHEIREEGRDWPPTAETMIGLRRLDNLQYCVMDVLDRGIPGDLLEAGVWRGGASIFMRAVLKVRNEKQRRVWVADSFQGLPKPRPDLYPADEGDDIWTCEFMAVPLEEVKRNFVRYGLLDDQVKFLVGWFSDTMPNAPVERLAVLRLDGDMYQSTMEVLQALYPKLSIGGYVIVDDYGALEPCRKAVEDYRNSHGIREEVRVVDCTGVFWQKLR